MEAVARYRVPVATVRRLRSPPWEGLTHVVLAADQSRHALRVLRLRAGDVVHLLDERGALAEGVLDGEEDGLARVRIARPLASPPPPARPVHILCALPKARAARWIVQKGTELGIASLTFVGTERGAVRPGGRTAQAWERIAAEACKQCGRTAPPAVSWAGDLAAAVAGAGDVSQHGMADPDPGAIPIAAWLRSIPPDAPVRIWIGPEGGWTDAERAAIEGAGATRFRLGPTVLRVETAVLAAASCAMFGRDPG